MASARREPRQQRSRELYEAVLQAAMDLIVETDGGALVVRDVAQRAGVPASSVYQYFSNGDDIIKALLDREMAKMDGAVAAAIGALEHISLRALCSASIHAHFDHHKSQANSAQLWFSVRQSAAVREHIRDQDARLANWLYSASMSAGFLRDDTPHYGVELIVRVTDRMFEYALIPERPAAERDDIVARFVEWVVDAIESYGTRAGVEGIPSTDFVAALTASALNAS